MTEQEKQEIRDKLSIVTRPNELIIDVRFLLDALDERDKEIGALIDEKFWIEKENQRLRKALEWIADTTGDQHTRLVGCPSIARKALNGDDSE